jgi:hypothetical protein
MFTAAVHKDRKVQTHQAFLSDIDIWPLPRCSTGPVGNEKIEPLRPIRPLRWRPVHFSVGSVDWERRWGEIGAVENAATAGSASIVCGCNTRAGSMHVRVCRLSRG